MHLDIQVRPTGKPTGYAFLAHAQVDALRGEAGCGRVHVILRFGALKAGRRPLVERRA